MKTASSLDSTNQTVTVRVPMAIRRRGGRKVVLSPSGQSQTWAPSRRRIDNALVKAIARAFRWREMLEAGTYATITEIAEVEKINESYVGRVLRVTLLAPALVEAILMGKQSPSLQLEDLLRAFPTIWREQAMHFAVRF